jgi:hypothetical protein
MTTFTQLTSASFHPPEPFTDQLRLAVAAYLARFKGSSREHTESDLRCYLAWCAERGLDPLAAKRPHLELYIRWMQEIRRFKPSTVSRRFSVTAGFYRTCALDGIIEHSYHPAVTLQVLPYSEGAHLAVSGSFTILRFAEPDLQDVVYIEELTSALYLESPVEVDHYIGIMDHVHLQAKPVPDSRKLLGQILADI